MGYESVDEFGADLDIIKDWKEPFRQGGVYYLRSRHVRGLLLWNTRGRLDAAHHPIERQDCPRWTGLV